LSLPVIDYLADKRIMILGYGREGRSTLAFIRRFLPDKELTVADYARIEMADPFVMTVCGESYLSGINNYDIVIKSPGIPFIGISVGEKTEITCQLDLFLRFFGQTVIGVTGTKGKTTTSTLIYEMLKSKGLNCALIGNIGVPVFDVPENTKIAVVEMSSHQLEFTRASAHIAVLVNIYEEHLDHYKDGFKGYVNAKLNIARFQTQEDYFIYNPEQRDEKITDLKKITKGRIIEVPFSKAVSDCFIIHLQSLTPHLLGEHSRQNLGYAVAVARIFGVSDDCMEKAIRSFKGIEHRLEFAGKYRGIEFYNDSIATIPTAVINAVKTLKNVDTLIFGGLDRGIDYSLLLDFLSDGKVPNLAGLPETGHKIIDALKKNRCQSRLLKAENMEQAVSFAYKNTRRGRVCLFSPAAASYNKYKNFEEKGKHFKECIKIQGEQ